MKYVPVAVTTDLRSYVPTIFGRYSSTHLMEYGQKTIEPREDSFSFFYSVLIPSTALSSVRSKLNPIAYQCFFPPKSR